MNLYWGVDSYNPASHRINTPQIYYNTGDPRSQTLFEFITRRVRQPDFWGRYLNSYSYGISATERSYIFQESNGRCKVLLVYNGPFRSGPDLIGPNAFLNGTRAASEAIRLASNINAPAFTRIYVDLERWLVSPDWFHGWIEVMSRSLFPTIGIYGNPRVESRAEGFRQGLSQTLGSRADQQFDPLIHLLATGGNLGPTSTGLRSISSNVYIWANRPYVIPSNQDYNVILTNFRPEVIPLRHLGSSLFSDTVIWQYGPNITFHHSRGLFDLNLCTGRGYAEMW